MLEHLEKWVAFDEQREKYVHSWSLRGQQPIASVCIVHGLGEHGGRYHTLAERLATRGFQVLCFDQQGHGQSKLPAGCIESYSSLLKDIGDFASWAERTFGVPVSLLGHSMGGNLVLNYALRMQNMPRCIISSSPMIRVARKRTWLVEQVGRMLLPFVPNVRLRSNTPVERIMDDPIEQQLLRDDALFHRRLSLRLGAALLDSGAWLLENADQLKTPTLLSHGTTDYLTCPKASAEFAERAGPACHLTLWEGQLHDPFRGMEKERVIDSFVSFINQHCQ